MGGIPQGPRPDARSCARFDTGTEPPWACRPESRIGEAASGVTGGGFSSRSRREERAAVPFPLASGGRRSEEHTSELQSLMRISYAVFCLKKKTNIQNTLSTRRDNKN